MMDRRFDLEGSVVLYRSLQPTDDCPVRDGRR